VRNLFRCFVAFAAVAVVATGAAACKSADPYAAKVNGAVLSKADLDDELNAIRDNKKYLSSLEQNQVTVKGTGDGTFNSQFVARLLTRRIYFELIHEEFTRRHLKLGSKDLNIARQEVTSSLADPNDPSQAASGPVVLAAFPKSYQTWLIHTNAEVYVLQNALADTSDTNLRAYYEAHKDQFESVCAAHILVDTKPEADAIEKQLAKAKDKNATFADIAKKQSKDTGSGAKGGDLGCAAPSNYVAEFKAAVRTQKIGVIGQPVKSQFGYHIIRVDSRTEAKPFEEVKEDVKSAVTDSQQGPFNDFLTKASAKAKVEVNPRYGTYDTTGQQPEVVPPKTPDAANDTGNTGNTANPGG
jgi:foldase protein PrsA